MSTIQLILWGGAAMLALGAAAVLVWLAYTAWIQRLERRLAVRKGVYRDLVTGLAAREKELLEPVLRQLGSLRDMEALEALLEEQARTATGRPAWLLDAYDRLGLVERYVQRLRTARAWRERAFAAELLGRVGNAQAVPALLETAMATRSEDADVREIALRALARIADPRAVPALVEALRRAEAWLAPRVADILTRHGDEVVDPLIAFLEEPARHPARAWAVSILGEVKAQRAFPVLVRSLGDLDDEVRAKAATALSRLGDRRAVPYLLENLLSDPAPFVRSRIATALGRYNDVDVVDRLVRALGDPAWWVRMRSVEALEQIGPDAEGPLLVALDDADPEIRMRAAVALERLGVPARLVKAIAEGDRAEDAQRTLAKFALAGARELLAEELVHRSPAVRAAVLDAIRQADRRDLAEELVRRATEDPEAPIRARALDTLRALGARDALPAALEGTNDGDARVRAAALDLLAAIGPAEQAGAVRALVRDNDAAVRAAAARALGRLGGAAQDDLLKLLTDPAAEVRCAAVESAAAAGLRALAPALADTLADADAEVRRRAIEALGQLREPAAIPALIRATRGDPALRPRIAEAVVRIDPGAVAELVDVLLEQQDVGGRLALVDALGRLRQPTAAPMLLALREDPNPEVRAATMVALGGTGAPAALAAAIATLRDPDAGVRARAVDALARLRARDQGPRLLELVRTDPAAVVRERAALAIGLLEVPGGEAVLLASSEDRQPPAVLAAAVLALGAYQQESMVARVLTVADQPAVQAVLQGRLEADPLFRELAERLRQSRRVELRALAAPSRARMEEELAEGIRSSLDAGERVRLVAGLRALQGERSRGALVQVTRSDPSPAVRAAGLTAVAGMLDGDELFAAARRGLGDPSPEVQRTAVALFQRVSPERGLPVLVQALRGSDDETLAAAIALQADAAFEAFVDLALGLAPDSEDAPLVLRVARYMRHAGLVPLLAPMARSAATGVRHLLARTWEARPELVDLEALAALVLDPVPIVRRAALRAAVAAGRPDLLGGRADDPDPLVRRDAALLLARVPGAEVPAGLAQDPDPQVRAAALVALLAHGAPVALDARADLAAAAEAVREGLDADHLRDVAAASPDVARRRGAALCLALLGDAAARGVAERDPDADVRAEVAALLARAGARG